LHRAALAANEVSRRYAEVVQRLLQTTGLTAKEVSAIGAHGQTVRHQPQAFDGTGYTWQLINGALLAELTGIGTVCDLRSRDVAAADEASFEEKAKACQSPTPFGRAGATLFDRQSSGVLTRRSSFAAAEEKQAADVSYKEVRIERFGWRRSSFISRSDSPMLVR
jgi:hypothetical protein